jgi:gamma-glutamyltranspeptidase
VITPSVLQMLAKRHKSLYKMVLVVGAQGSHQYPQTKESVLLKTVEEDRFLKEMENAENVNCIPNQTQQEETVFQKLHVAEMLESVKMVIVSIVQKVKY